MEFLLYCIACLWMTFQTVSSYSGGAPTFACTTMTPQHGSQPMVIPCPYQLSTDVQCFRPGQRITLLLRDPSGQSFKGMLVQARIQTDSNPQSYGVFDQNSNSDLQMIGCFGAQADAITHSNALPKLSKEFGWTAPPSFSGSSVDFMYTVVKDYSTFWVLNKFTFPVCTEPTTTTILLLDQSTKTSVSEIITFTSANQLTSDVNSQSQIDTTGIESNTATSEAGPSDFVDLSTGQTTTAQESYDVSVGGETSPSPSPSITAEENSASPLFIATEGNSESSISQSEGTGDLLVRSPLVATFSGSSCVDSSPECQSTSPYKCYNQEVRSRCCSSCSAIAASLRPPVGGCEFGDRINICGFFQHPTFCHYYMDECCYSCRNFL